MKSTTRIRTEASPGRPRSCSSTSRSRSAATPRSRRSGTRMRCAGCASTRSRTSRARRRRSARARERRRSAHAFARGVPQAVRSGARPDRITSWICRAAADLGRQSRRRAEHALARERTRRAARAPAARAGSRAHLGGAVREADRDRGSGPGAPGHRGRGRCRRLRPRRAARAHGGARAALRGDAPRRHLGRVRLSDGRTLRVEHRGCADRRSVLPDRLRARSRRPSRAVRALRR